MTFTQRGQVAYPVDWSPADKNTIASVRQGSKGGAEDIRAHWMAVSQTPLASKVAVMAFEISREFGHCVRSSSF
ncbi:hypothetical protein [Deinococcus sp. QL22]|uniref:hypothetical protein n=1 Tax=Deinococcus sp. QL22 TaxID=2939437 RepID=UPI0020182913|nr:hypothetical protein [Deinococcus sp. QL22]UQN09472.1 hypothetical protein M1R55_23255 [Deinococcus sp. QL22]